MEAESPVVDGEKVLYDNLGQPYIHNVSTGELKPLSPEKGGKLMRDDKGRWLPHVRKKALGMYLEGASRYEISEKLGVPAHTIRKWITGRDQSSTHPDCFYQIKKKQIKELLEHNKDVVINVNRGMLKHAEEFLNNPRTKITQVKEFRDLIESYAKLNQLNEVGDNNLQINFNVPMTMEEAARVIASDPILVEAKETPVEDSTTEEKDN